MIKHISQFTLLIAVSVITACGSKEDKKDVPKKPAGQTATFDATIVKSFPVNRDIEAPGTILPGEIAELRPEISGRVTAISFREGAFVRKGTLLVKLFDADLQAQLKKLQVQLKIAQTADQRQKELIAINGTSQQEYDNTTLNVGNIRADIDLLKVNISRTEIRAPFDGRMGLRQISPGAYVTPVNIISNIAATSQKKIQFPVPEQYVDDLASGTTITFTITGSGKKYFANIMATENAIVADTRNLMAKALVTNNDENLKPGAYADVFIHIGNNAPAMMVPSQSVIPQTRGKKVIVVRSGMTVFQTVETGFRDSSNVEILSGLMNGDTILTSGLLVVKPEQKIGKLNLKK